MATKTPAKRTAAAPGAPLFIDFRIREGAPVRRMNVRIPSPEQLSVWETIGEQLTAMGNQWKEQNAATVGMAADHPDVQALRVQQNRQAARALRRSLRLIKSVLPDEIDHDWIDEQILEGAKLEELLAIVHETVKAVEVAAAQSGGTVATGPKPSKAVLSE